MRLVALSPETTIVVFFFKEFSQLQDNIFFTLPHYLPRALSPSCFHVLPYR